MRKLLCLIVLLSVCLQAQQSYLPHRRAAFVRYVAAGGSAPSPNVESFGETNTTSGFAIYTNIINISGANRLLVMFPGGGDNTAGALTVTNITVGGPVGTGTAMTSNTIARSSTWCGQNAWHLVNPTSGSSTCYVYCLNSGADHFGIVWANLTNVHQTTPIRHYTNGASASTAPSLVISSAANDLFISGLSTDDDNSIAISVGGQVMQGSLIGGGPDFTRLAIGTNAGAATSTITWTTDNEQWAKVGLSVRPP